MAGTLVRLADWASPDHRIIDRWSPTHLANGETVRRYSRT